MSRDIDKSMTRFLPILIPAAHEARTHGSVGSVSFQDDRLTNIQPVSEFVVPKTAPKRFEAIAKIFSLASGKKIDSLILKEQLPSLFREAFPERLVDALIREAINSPKEFASRWLEPIFNREIGAARLVIWSSPGQLSRPAIYCPNEETALFVHLLFAGISACLGCGKLFTPHRPNQLYHDFLCANRHRKRRERLAKGTNVRTRKRPKRRY